MYRPFGANNQRVMNPVTEVGIYVDVKL